VHQMEIGEGRKNVVMVVDAGNGYGYGHLMRSRELAMQITERLGWPVAFVVSDDKAVRLLNDSGLRTTQKIRIPEIKTGGREDGDNSNGFQISEVSSPFDLIILDIYYKRDLGTGWKSMFPCNSKVVVLDHCGEWTKEADLVVIPGVAYNGSRWTKKVGYPRTVGGKHYVILRREIRRLRDRHMKKDIDLLAYLHSSDQKEAVRNLDTGDGLKVHVVQGFDSNFPELLARSRMFLSGFGYSFYEALALGSYPITLPLSDTHRTDAMKFYDRLGLPRGLVESVGEIENTITDLAQRWEKTGSMKTEDGTPRIVEEFASLLRNEQS
jgi:spore coat polysaccharide biosynthesis predicted glycosyltransferase SpsG